MPLLLGLPISPELEARRIESQLLNRAVDLGGIQIFRPQQGRWRPQSPAAAPLTPLTIVHVWAVECPPCVAELPILRNMTRAYTKSERDIRFVFITETLEEDRLRAFRTAHAADMPESELFQSTDGRLRKSLQTGKQPITLLVDKDLIIRQAFVGSIAERRNELVDAIERMLQTVKKKT